MQISKLSTTTFPDYKDDRLPRGYLSASQISKYLSCPKDYYFAYVEGKKFKANERMVLGTCVHKLIENCITLKVDNNNASPAMEAILDDSKTLVSELYYDDNGEAPDEAELGLDSIIDSAQKSFITWYKNKMHLISPIASEKECLFTIGDIPIKGFIDYLDLTPHGVKVVDIKVGKKKRDPNDSLQLGLYAVGEGTNVVGFDTILQPTKRLDHRLEATEAILPQSYLRHVTSMVVNVHRGITSGFFPECLPDHWLCNPKWCSNFNQCRGKV